MSLKIAVIACVAVMAFADQSPYPAPPAYAPPAPYHPPPKGYPAEPEYPDVSIKKKKISCGSHSQFRSLCLPQVPPKYNYNYGVADGYSGANFAASESRDGYKTEGSYTVDLPDGRKQIVTYVDNGDGLVAEVTYEGEAQYPEYTPTYKPAPPAYKPAPPTYA
ncbi:cuticle protein 8-like [Penaeus monodon]|uniref:cuticle protein 8-like n=1 Tax=Penaeus monodon TaxID=6687 RepID=UPI0018A7142A|nr:cuticle protein 8-like [Penaeus monodon]